MTRQLKKNFILALVFATGACSLIVEVVALRVLSPYFGNTIFTASSVIGTVLCALSLGYYLGGRLADKHGNAAWISGLVFVAGLTVLVIEIFNVTLLPWLAPNFSLTVGPLVASVALFFLPSLFLGTLSPFAIAILHNDAVEGVARLAGAVFFWSTLGSIVGSLASGFLLIPNFGIDRILIGVGLTLCLLGFAPRLILNYRAKRKLGLGSFVVFFFIVVCFFSLIFLQTRNVSAGVIFNTDGTYEALTIRDGEWRGRRVRFFFQDRSYSGAMFTGQMMATDTVDNMVFDYTKYFSLYRELKPDVKNALVIGGGAYTVPKALLTDLPDVKVQVAEIEPSLLALGKKYFNVPDDPRLVNRVEDGRRVLAQSQQPFDLIFSDVYFSLFSIPAHFTTVEFFQLTKKKLSPDGVFIANLIGDLSRQEPSFLMSEIKTFRQVFPNAVVIGVDGQKTRELQNVMLVGVNSGEDAAEVEKKIQPLVQKLGGEVVDLQRYEFSPYTSLTDNFSPVDHLTASVIERMTDHDPNQPDGNEMLATISQQMRYGSRAMGTSGHDQLKDFLVSEAKAYTTQVIEQDWTHASVDGKEYPLTNIIARFNPEAKKRFVIGTHYDTRRYADRDAKNPDKPMPGANDGASGTAVLAELAKLLSLSYPTTSDVGIDLVWFDGEEGDPGVKDWQPIGSTYFADHLPEIYGDVKPIGGMVLDMVCAKGTSFRPETSSLRDAPQQTQDFWQMSVKNDPLHFKTDEQTEIWDDHTQLNRAGIPSFLVINFDYPFFHTTQDTLDKCDARSLQATATAVWNYVKSL